MKEAFDPRGEVRQENVAGENNVARRIGNTLPPRVLGDGIMIETHRLPDGRRAVIETLIERVSLVEIYTIPRGVA